MLVSSDSQSQSLSFSDYEIELMSISDEEVDLSSDESIKNLEQVTKLTSFEPTSKFNKISDNHSVTDKTHTVKDFLQNSIKEAQGKLDKNRNLKLAESMGFGVFMLGTPAGLEILMLALTSLSILSNPIGLIVGGVSLILAGLSGFGYFFYCVSKELSEKDKKNIEMEKKNLITIQNLMNENEGFKKHVESIQSPLSLEILMGHAELFLS